MRRLIYGHMIVGYAKFIVQFVWFEFSLFKSFTIFQQSRIISHVKNLPLGS